MLLSTALVIASTTSLAAAHPFRFLRRTVPSFPAGTSFDILLAKGDTNLDDLSGTDAEAFEIIDIDLFDNEATTIGNLKAAGKQVICYFSSGSREDWRDDASQFQSSDYGQAMEGWEGENWVNVKSENVKNIMKSRIQQAAQKGCNAVDPDNVDGYQENQDGFGYDKSAYVDYVKFMAQEAAANNLAIGLKNAVDMIPDVLDVVQFAVNEQCHEFNECDKYKPFTDANKAVFNIEYGGNNCDSPAGVKLTTIIKPEDQSLSTFGGQCASTGETQTTPEQPASSSAAASQPAASKAVSSATPTPTEAAVPTETATKTKASSTPTPTGSGDEDENEDDPEDENEDDEEDDDDEQSYGHHNGKHGHERR